MSGGAVQEEQDRGRKQKESEDDAGALTRFSAGGVCRAGMAGRPMRIKSVDGRGVDCIGFMSLGRPG